MRIANILVVLFFGLFSIQGWAPPPGKGGAAATPDLSLDIKKCNLIPRNQIKMKVKHKSGRHQFVCAGFADCEGKKVPLTCEASDKGVCPTANECRQVKSGDIARQISSPSRLNWPNDDDPTKEPGISYKLLTPYQDYYPIGLVYFALPGEGLTNRCTGVLVKNPNLRSTIKFAVLTAGSCLYSLKEKKAHNVTFQAEYPWTDYDPENNYFQAVEKLTVPKKFTKNREQAFDYGLVSFEINPSRIPSNCCLSIKVLSATPDRLNFPASSYELQKRDAGVELVLYKTKIKEFENLPLKNIRLFKNDINIDLGGKGSPLIANNPEGGSDKVVVGINVLAPTDRPGMVLTPLWTQDRINELWRCLEQGIVECGD